MPKSTRVTVADLPQDDSWFRDTGPVVSRGKPGLAWSRTCDKSLQMFSMHRNERHMHDQNPITGHIVQFVVRRDEGGRNVAIRGNDFVFNSWGHKNVTWDVDDEIADWVRFGRPELSLQLRRHATSAIAYTCVCHRRCRSCTMRELKGTGPSSCLRVARSMSMAKGAIAWVAQSA